MAPPHPLPDDAPHGSPFGGHGPLILAITWPQATLATIIMCLRAYTNRYLTHQFGSAFIWACIAWLACILDQVFITVSISWGLGNSLANLTEYEAGRAGVWSWAGQSTAIMAIALAKVAVVAFYLKLLGPTHRVQRIFLLFIAWSNMLINTTQCVLVWNQCNPPKKLWEPNTPGNCHLREPAQITGFVHAGWNAISDFVLAVYPAFFFWDLRLRLRVKVGLCLLMGSGVLATACACVKAYELTHVVDVDDPTRATAPLVVFAITEPWLVLMTGSLPPLWPLIKRGIRKIKHGSTSQSYKLSDNEQHPGSSGPRVNKSDLTGFSTLSGTRSSSRGPSRFLSRSSTKGHAEHDTTARTESQDAMLPIDGIAVTHDVEVALESREHLPPALKDNVGDKRKVTVQTRERSASSSDS